MTIESAATENPVLDALTMPTRAAIARAAESLVPPAAIPTTDHRPFTHPQLARREALRLSIQHHRATEADFTDTEVLATAERFAEFIRTGTQPGRP